MRAECLALALKTTTGQRSPDLDKLAESFVKWVKSPDHLIALTLAVEHRSRHEAILDGAEIYLKFITGKSVRKKTGQA